jgi:hypothetical protein
MMVDSSQNCIGAGVTGPGGGHPEGLSHGILEVLTQAGGKSIELGRILGILSRHSHALLLVFLSFPLCLPVGIPVLSTTLGLTLGLVGFLLCIGAELRIPKYLAARAIPYERLNYIVLRLVRIANWVEKFLRPRMLTAVANPNIMRIHGLFAMFMGLLAAVPLPLPFNNMVAAFPILVLGFSLLGKDGMIAVVSYIAAIPCFIYYGTLIYLGYAGFQRLLGIA